MPMTPSTMLDLGTPLPRFELPDVDGIPVSSAQFSGAPGLLGPLGRDASVAGDANRMDAERVMVRSSGARGIFVSESFHPKWTARWSDGSALPVYYAGPGLIYVPTPSADGTMTLEFGRAWIDYAVWALVLIGLALCAWPRLPSRRPGP